MDKPTAPLKCVQPECKKPAVIGLLCPLHYVEWHRKLNTPRKPKVPCCGEPDPD